MGKNGKHSKEKENKLRINNKILGIVLVICVVIVIAIIVYHYNMQNQEEISETAEEQKEESIETASIEEAIEEETDVEEAGIEETVVEKTMDTNVEDLINQIMVENHLNENNFFFFYYNLEEKKYYFYNENSYFTAASTIKVPVAMLYYDKVADGELSLSDTLLYDSDDYEAGDGSTAADYSVGESIPVSYLLEQTIVNSDNTALNILVHNIGYKKCKEELTKYSDVEIAEEFYSSNIANVSYYYDVLQYLYQNANKYSELIEYMKKSSGGEYLKANSPQYEVAHKYGSYDGYVHDYGIIYGKNTYLIGVFTKNIANASNLIAEIGEKVVNYVETEGIEETSDETESNTNSISITETNTGNTSDIQETNMENASD